MLVLNSKKQIKLKDFKSKRICHHRKVDLEVNVSVHTRKRHNHVSVEDKKKQKRKDKHMAYHHLHPEIIQEVIVNQGLTTIDKISKLLLKDLNLLREDGYTEADRFKETINNMGGAVYEAQPRLLQTPNSEKGSGVLLFSLGTDGAATLPS